jgi:hypothetical protein
VVLAPVLITRFVTLSLITTDPFELLSIAELAQCKPVIVIVVPFQSQVGWPAAMTSVPTPLLVTNTAPGAAEPEVL